MRDFKLIVPAALTFWLAVTNREYLFQTTSNGHRELGQIISFQSLENNGPLSAYEDQFQEMVHDVYPGNLTAVVHIGPMKTGSTSIQRLFIPLADALLEDGYENSLQNIQSNSMIRFVRCFRASEYGDKYQDFDQFGGNNACRDEIVTSVKEIAKRGHNVIISAEYIATHERDIDAFKRFLKPWKNVRVVAFYRRYYEWYASFCNQNEKYKPPTKRESMARGLILRSRSNTDFFDDFYIGSILRWQKNFKDFEVFNIHDIHPDGDVRDPFYCKALPNAKHTCEKFRKGKAEGLFDPKPNPSEPLVYKDLAYYARERGWWTEDKEKGLTFEKVAEMAQKRQEKDLGLTHLDFKGLHCPDSIALDWMLQKSLYAEKTLFPEFFEKQGEKEIREEFERIKHEKFCFVNATHALDEDPALQQFFKSL